MPGEDNMENLHLHCEGLIDGKLACVNEPLNFNSYRAFPISWHLKKSYVRISDACHVKLIFCYSFPHTKGNFLKKKMGQIAIKGLKG